VRGHTNAVLLTKPAGPCIQPEKYVLRSFGNGLAIDAVSASVEVKSAGPGRRVRSIEVTGPVIRVPGSIKYGVSGDPQDPSRPSNRGR
jgi:hypothetical protein